MTTACCVDIAGYQLRLGPFRFIENSVNDFQTL